MHSFRSFLMAGFECSSHRRGDRLRLDLIARTEHDQHCFEDYSLAAAHGLKTIRDGFRWHLIEEAPGCYNWSSIIPMLRAARQADVEVVWDLCHYGYPDWVDPWSQDFCDRFAAFALRAATLVREISGQDPRLCVMNEMSFWSWCGAEEGNINPWAVERGGAFKRQLLRAALAATRAIRAQHPGATFISAEPLINIVRDTNDQTDIEAAKAYHMSQYEVTDILTGRGATDLGGFDDAIDVIGLNYYPHNQWRLRGGFVPLGHHDYKPLRELLDEVYKRYRKPVFLAETGAEHSARPVWLSYVCREVRAAIMMGVPVRGICLYPITNYYGWDNERLCHAGLFSTTDQNGMRSPEPDFAEELQRQISLIDALSTPPRFALRHDNEASRNRFS